MDNITETSRQHLKKLQQDISHFTCMTQDEFFDLDFREVEALQFKHLRARFKELRPKVRILDRLASEVGINEIADWDDLVPLTLPHTIYKGYLASDVEKGRFDRLTRWLSTTTAHDLSRVDLSGCQSLDDWIQRVETATPLRPLTSSGSSGKISIVPRDVNDDYTWFCSVVIFLSPYYQGRKSVEFRSGKVPMLCPLPFDKGHSSTMLLLRVLRQHLYGGREDMVVTMARDTMLVEEQWLAGKLKRAEMLGEELILTDRERMVVQALRERPKAVAGLMANYAKRVVADFRGRHIAFLTGWPTLYDFVVHCKKLGITPEWAPGSVFFIGGGNKGIELPDGWRETIEEVIPAGRYVLKDMYGMSEITAIVPICLEGNLHPFPWLIFRVVDPETSKPLSRHGIQTGRMMIFDLMPRAFWAGLLTGDEVTIHWEGGCSCGRKGPYFENSVRRYSEARDGDDRITCVRSIDAYHKLEQFAVSDAIL